MLLSEQYKFLWLPSKSDTAFWRTCRPLLKMKSDYHAGLGYPLGTNFQITITVHVKTQDIKQASCSWLCRNFPLVIAIIKHSYWHSLIGLASQSMTNTISTNRVSPPWIRVPTYREYKTPGHSELIFKCQTHLSKPHQATHNLFTFSIERKKKEKKKEKYLEAFQNVFYQMGQMGFKTKLGYLWTLGKEDEKL